MIQWFDVLGAALERAATENKILLTYIWAPG